MDGSVFGMVCGYQFRGCDSRCVHCSRGELANRQESLVAIQTDKKMFLDGNDLNLRHTTERKQFQ
jgi:hypothetical protein